MPTDDGPTRPLTLAELLDDCASGADKLDSDTALGSVVPELSAVFMVPLIR